MENYSGLKKILQYILLYYMDNSDKQKISKYLSKEISMVGKEKVTEFLEWHRLLPLLPPNSEINNTVCKAKTADINKYMLELSNEITVNFKYNKIDFCFIKGISLIEALYNDISCRYFKDIDLFVATKDLDKAEVIVSSMGFKHGQVFKQLFIPATKAQIKFQRLYTHELYRFVKQEHDMFYFIDINHLFSWIEFGHSRQIRLEDIHDNITQYDRNQMPFPILNDTYQFIHLCVHFYNEAVYFALDTSYDGHPPHEIRMFRLFDICLLILKKNLNAHSIANIGYTMHANNKICYVLSLIHYIFEDLVDLTEFKYYYDFASSVIDNEYYLKDGSKHEWPINFCERVFDISKRKNIHLISN